MGRRELRYASVLLDNSKVDSINSLSFTIELDSPRAEAHKSLSTSFPAFSPLAI